MLNTAALVITGGAFAGGFVSGLAGFGTALPWRWASGCAFLNPAVAAALVVICSVVAQTQTIPTVWHAVDRARVGPMIAAGLLGVPAGGWLLPAG